MLRSKMTPPLQPKTHPGAPLTPVLSITSTLPFSIDLQPTLSKGLTHSLKNTRGYTPKSESKAKITPQPRLFLGSSPVHPLSVAPQPALSNPPLPSLPRNSVETNSPTAHLKG